MSVEYGKSRTNCALNWATVDDVYKPHVPLGKTPEGEYGYLGRLGNIRILETCVINFGRSQSEYTSELTVTAVLEHEVV